jgi:hypothetical protein
LLDCRHSHRIVFFVFFVFSTSRLLNLLLERRPFSSISHGTSVLPTNHVSNNGSLIAILSVCQTINEAKLRHTFSQQAATDGTMDIATFQMILKSFELDPTDYAVNEAINECSSASPSLF